MDKDSKPVKSNLTGKDASENESIHQVDLDRSWISRLVWFILGFIIMVIGLIGIVVPGLPTTPLMILAAACYAKSSQKFYDWIINNKLFGHHVKNYREGKGIPKKSKPVILGTLWVFVLFAVLIAIPDSAPPVSKITVLVLAVIGTIVIVRIPNLKQ
ncbi:MAG: Inner membrane protein YbaN [Methanobacteriota archaeon]|nr:MAG: Inner membrane protein YbaN [Euryarchaeota archaeon]